jgi:hypothetical protein
MFKINQRGFWESEQASGYHIFDSLLCTGLINYLKEKNIQSVYDFGCGMGDYAKEIIKQGIVCKAYDGNPSTKELTGGIGDVLDLSEPVQLEKLDCVLSLEVGEHLPVEYEQIFIDNVVNNATSKIILSWAVEGQGGTGHFNCRNNDYVINELAKRGFKYDEESSLNLRKYVSNAGWFRDTLMVFDK